MTGSSRSICVLGLALLPASLVVPGPQPVAQSMSSVTSGAAVLEQSAAPRPTHWRLTKPARNRQIEGYATRVSVLPGQQVGLKISTGAARYRIVAFRFGAYGPHKIAKQVWSSRWHHGHRQPPAKFSKRRMRTIVAPWHRSLTVSTNGWRPGAYVFKLIAGNGWQAHVPFFVRSRSGRGKLALVAPVTTWQAYNDWGGYSLYVGPPGDRRSWAVSFDRPYPPPGQPGPRQNLAGVLQAVVMAGRLGPRVAYLTNVDLDAHPNALRGAKGMIMVGHSEYWTRQMRRQVSRARAHGTNLAFFGANTMYWRIRLQKARSGPNRLEVGWRSDAASDPVAQAHPRLTTARWRDRPHPDKESKLTGMLYECFPVDSPYRVVSPRWWGFRGTHVHRGDRFPHLVGTEADRVYPIRSTPRPLQILSNVRYSCGGVGTSAQSVYYTTRSGAGVFTAGTLNWMCALLPKCSPGFPSHRTRNFVHRTTANILKAFARGPAGRRHPARDNVRKFHLPKHNQVPASRVVSGSD